MDEVLFHIDSHNYSLQGLVAIGIGTMASVVVLWAVGRAVGARSVLAGTVISCILLLVIGSLAGLPGSFVLRMAPAWLGVAYIATQHAKLSTVILLRGIALALGAAAFMSMMSGNSLVSVLALTGTGGLLFLADRTPSLPVSTPSALSE